MSLKELQSLIGLLTFACCVVVPGRAFLRRLIDQTKGIRKSHHHVRLTKDTKHDILVWHDFLRSYNGKSFFLSSRWETSKSPNLFTNAAGSLGYAAIFGTHWFFGEWPDGWKIFNITLLEFFPIVLAVEIWGSIMRGRCIVFFSDNEAVVEIINRKIKLLRIGGSWSCLGTSFYILLNTTFYLTLSILPAHLIAKAMPYLAYRSRNSDSSRLTQTTSRRRFWGAYNPSIGTSHDRTSSLSH